MRISSKILAVISLMAFALFTQSASACVYPDGKCAAAATEEAAPAAEEAAPAAEEAAPAAEEAPAEEAAAE